MKIQVHRGTREIGGTCIEVTSGDTRIVLDIGMPLMNEDGSEFEFAKHKDKSGQQLFDEGVLPRVSGLYNWQEPSVAALFITHGHQDHYGFLEYVHPEIPVHMSEGTKRLIHLYPEFAGTAPSFGKIRTFNRRAVIEAGPFRVSPYLVDHSTFSAFAYEIEAEGKRIFYTGDFRGHGYMKVTLDFIYAHVRPGLDALLMEGTMLGRDDEPLISEEDLRDEAAIICQQTDKAVMVWQSSQNAARIFSFYEAAKLSKRLFVLDVFTAYVLHELSKTEGGSSLPYPGKPGYDDVRVWYPFKLADKLKQNGKERILHLHAHHKIDKEAVAEDPSRIMMFVRKGMENDIERYHGLHSGTLIYSMWDGYMEKDDGKRFLNKAAELGIGIRQLHSSGHAGLDELQRMVDNTKPGLLVPIHTQFPEMFREHFDCAIASPDEARNGIEV